MQHLTTLDASFLQAEDSDPHVSLAVGAVSIIEGPQPDYHELIEVFAERAHRIPRCTQIVRMPPFDLAAPEWVDDPYFDIGHHLHRVAVPAPGADAELFAMIATIMERRLDRDRPLWECWIIEGLAAGRWATLIKIHHCIADGIATAQMLAKLSDDGAGETFAADIRAARESGSSIVGLLRPRLNPVAWMSGAWRATLTAGSAAEHAIVGAAELTARVLAPGQESSLNGPVTGMRRFSAATVDLGVMKDVSRHFGVTLNDVALAAITSGYRNMLLARGESPGPRTLRTLVPVSMRSASDFDVTDNRVSAMLPLLPVDEPDPVRQLDIVHRRLLRAKGSGQREGGTAVFAAAGNIPFALSAWTIRFLTRLPQKSVTALATNVPGPRGRQRVLGRKVVEILPIPPIALHLRTGIAMLSYARRFSFGITADYDTAPDVDTLARGIENGVQCLADLCGVGRGPGSGVPARPNAEAANDKNPA
ncbi:wax ester/triacylglycerol synthase family O-acyltransferase [Mycolicibacterium sp. PAM1]|uniref:WS/DGAT/MGAT family O-acyltransferase n=1 Tax=Mycolicibacterium sp. PAM1 TaxID=2853535 RepID=UPI001C3E167B|nr:wax ester/triacylglycerol synthase family O-acyltransferase [Mycolicibacterium sp. PAM1]MBV5243053.1 wax ester/triacylglycerol synthase family O-acyltransferase [Mycolicibacterium sp. PAM1]